MNRCEFKDCKKHSEFFIGFSKIIQNDSSGFLCGDDVDYIQEFCLEHFKSLDGCGNVMKFRKIGEVRWYNEWDYSISYYLTDIVKIN